MNMLWGNRLRVRWWRRDEELECGVLTAMAGLVMYPDLRRPNAHLFQGSCTCVELHTVGATVSFCPVAEDWHSL